MFKEFIEKMEKQVEEIDNQIGAKEEEIKTLKSDRAVINRQLKSMKRNQDLLEGNESEDEEESVQY